ncbi:MAG: diguanylate cyclase [Clostridiales bacterium]|nr:diguanylate cyclase [Clostridiales bacterium]
MEANEPYKEIFENLNDGVYYVDRDRRITFWNKGAERISGFSSDEVINTHCYDNVLMHTNDEGTQLCIRGCPLLDSIQTNQTNVASVYLQHKKGYRVPVSVRTIPLEEKGEVYGAVEIFQVQHERMESLYNVEELKTLALTDQLTALPNRRYTETFLQSRISEHQALGIQFGVLFLDIDHFKRFNDQYGHGVGDDVLRILAQTFTNNLRNGDFIGRWGGEEFVGICVCPDEDSLRQAAERIRILVEKTSIPYEDHALSVHISIGATLYQANETAEQVIRRADGLLYTSKANGRNRVTLG